MPRELHINSQHEDSLSTTGDFQSSVGNVMHITVGYRISNCLYADGASSLNHGCVLTSRKRLARTGKLVGKGASSLKSCRAISTTHSTTRQQASSLAVVHKLRPLPVLRVRPIEFQQHPCLPYRKLFGTGSTDGNFKPCWKHARVNVAAAGYNGLTLDIVTWQALSLVEEARSQAQEPSSQVLDAVQLDRTAAGDQFSTSSAEPFATFIIYLPRGPFPGHKQSSEHAFNEFLEAFETRQLSCPSLPLTIVKVNYRLTPITGGDGLTEHHLYPIPVFDVNWALDYVKSQYQENFENGATLCIYGQNFGGSLGITLALTDFNNIHAVIVKDPIVDWTSLDELAKLDTKSTNASSAPDAISNSDATTEIENSDVSRRRTRNIARERWKAAYRSAQAQAAMALIDLRTKFFNNPSGFFDRFASPLLFLRAPGRDTPLWSTAKPEPDSSISNQTTAAYGTYDDDWSALKNGVLDEESDPSMPGDGEQLDTLAEAIGADAIGYVLKDSHSHGTSIPAKQSPSDQQVIGGSLVKATEAARALDSAETPKAVKRRKVLLRWPSVGTPGEALLPHIKIQSTNPEPTDLDTAHTKGPNEIDFATVLSPQAREMTEVMRRACFWGRGKDLAEQRVTFESIESGTSNKDASVEAAVTWLHEKIAES